MKNNDNINENYDIKSHAKQCNPGRLAGRRAQASAVIIILIILGIIIIIISIINVSSIIQYLLWYCRMILKATKAVTITIRN